MNIMQQNRYLQIKSSSSICTLHNKPIINLKQLCLFSSSSGCPLPRQLHPRPFLWISFSCSFYCRLCSSSPSHPPLHLQLEISHRTSQRSQIQRTSNFKGFQSLENTKQCKPNMLKYKVNSVFHNRKYDTEQIQRERTEQNLSANHNIQRLTISSTCLELTTHITRFVRVYIHLRIHLFSFIHNSSCALFICL